MNVTAWSEDASWPPTRFTERRLRSALAARIDALVAFLGFVLIGISLVDSVVSWPSDRVFLSPERLERVAGVILLPTWPWLMVSGLLLYGFKRANYHRARRGPRPRTGPLVAFLVLAFVCAVVIVGGFFLGVGKGSTHVLPGPRYEVSTPSLNDAQWTTVSHREFLRWQARFLRLDAMFSLFGLVMLMGGTRLRTAHRQFVESPGPIGL